MSSNDWEEVKRLAADFQRAQLSSSALALSERNCVEVINKLIELKLLDVVFTTDGKEYITPQYLIKEIKDELYVSGGRINLVELARNLNVDYSHIENKAVEVERSTPGCQIILGQLIDKNYTNTISQQINEKLKQSGQINVNELTKLYDLPGEFLQNVIEKNIGKIIQAKQDKVDQRLFFTDAFVEHNKCVVRGALAGLTKPIQVSYILQFCEIQERDFYFAFEQLQEDKSAQGALTAKQGTNTLYIPHVYTKQQSTWVTNFYKQNGYLEYAALIRLGISEPLMFIKRLFPEEKFLELESCVLGSQLLSQVDDSIDEAISSGTYLDLLMILPSVFSNNDVSKVLENVLKRNTTKMVVHIFCDTILVTEKFVQNLTTIFTEGILLQKAEESIESGEYLKAMTEKKLIKSGKEVEDTKAERKEERRKKAAGGKGGGGTQGRETKTKSTKKKQAGYKAKAEEDSDDDTNRNSSKINSGLLEIINVEDIEKVLNTNESLADEEGTDLVSAIATYLYPTLNKSAFTIAEEIFMRSQASQVGDRRKYHLQLQEKIENWVAELRMVDKGLKWLNDKDLCNKLTNHLIRTTGQDLVNALFNYLGQEHSRSFQKEKEMTPEVRNRLLQEFPSDIKESLQKLNKTLSCCNVEEFLNTVEVALPTADLMLKKYDKKKEKNWLINRRELLLHQLNESDDPALILHLAILVIIQAVAQAPINASGKFVPSLLQLLSAHLSSEDFNSLQEFQDSVLKLLTTDDDELKMQIRQKLIEETQKVRNIASTYKKIQ